MLPLSLSRGIGTYAAANVLIAMAPTAIALIGYRFIAGLGGLLLLPAEIRPAASQAPRAPEASGTPASR